MVKAVFRSTRKSSQKKLVYFKTGDEIVSEGDRGETMYVLQGGRVEIYKSGEDAQETVLAVLEKGDFFGEMAVLEKLPRSASARALEETTLLEIDAQQFDRMLRTRPEISVRIMRKFSRRLRETDRLLREATGQGVESMESDASQSAPEGAVAVGGVVFDTVVESATKGPCLAHSATGTVYDLPVRGEATIGRYDRVTGLSPDIDLTAVDRLGTSGYLHARLYIEDEEITLLEELANGSSTAINDQTLETGVRVRIEHGDTIRLGDVVLTFRSS